MSVRERAIKNQEEVVQAQQSELAVSDLSELIDRSLRFRGTMARARIAPSAKISRREVMMLKNVPVAAVLAVSDLEKAVEFYGGTLGLKKVAMPGEMEEGIAAFEAGQGSNLFIYEREGGSDASHTVVAFLAEDVEAIVADLSAKGVVIEQVEAGDMKTDERGIATLGPYQTAYIKDPEGNWISITTNPL